MPLQLTHLKLIKGKISKIIQSVGSFGSCLGNLGKKALTNIAIPLAIDNLPVISYKISETNSSFRVKERTRGKV